MAFSPALNKVVTTNKAINGFLWAFTSAGGQTVLQIGFLVILARLLTPEDFGSVALAIAIVGFGKIFAQLGLGPAIVRVEEISPGLINTANSIALVLGLIIAITAWTLAPFVGHFYRLEKLEDFLRVLSFAFLLFGPIAIAAGLYKRDLKFRFIAITEIISYAVGYGFLGIVMAVYGMGGWALVGAFIGHQLLRCIILVTGKFNHAGIGFDIEAFKYLVNFSGGFSLARIANFSASQIDVLVVGKYLGSHSTGLYTNAYQLMTRPSVLIGQIFDNVLFPIAAKLQKDERRLSLTYRYGIGTVTIIIIPISVIVFELSAEIISVLLGKQWLEAEPLLQLFSIAMLFRCGAKVF